MPGQHGKSQIEAEVSRLLWPGVVELACVKQQNALEQLRQARVGLPAGLADDGVAALMGDEGAQGGSVAAQVFADLAHQEVEQFGRLESLPLGGVQDGLHLSIAALQDMDLHRAEELILALDSAIDGTDGCAGAAADFLERESLIATLLKEHDGRLKHTFERGAAAILLGRVKGNCLERSHCI